MPKYLYAFLGSSFVVTICDSLPVILFAIINVLYFCLCTSRNICAMSGIDIFCSSKISCFPGMLLRYLLTNFEMVAVAPVVTSHNLCFYITLHILCISMVRFFYRRIFSASSFLTFVSPEIATSINVHISLSRIIITMSGLLLGMLLTVFTYSFHNVVTLSSRLVLTNSGTCSY
jgi:hypothetical protein